MTLAVKALNPADLAGKKVLLRCDLNVPLKDDGAGGRVITDDGRIRASLPTLKKILDAGLPPRLAERLAFGR